MQESYYFRTLQECDADDMVKIFEDVYPEREPTAACLGRGPEDIRQSKNDSVQVWPTRGLNRTLAAEKIESANLK